MYEQQVKTVSDNLEGISEAMNTLYELLGENPNTDLLYSCADQLDKASTHLAKGAALLRKIQDARLSQELQGL